MNNNAMTRIGAALHLGLLCVVPGVATGQNTFTDVAPNAGIQYARVPSAHHAVMESIMQASLDEPVTMQAMPTFPMFSRGAPGVALLDYDDDGDLDIYVTNGPGASNSLFANQLSQSGALGFVDVADSAGVGAAVQDSTGVCFGDIDNDGDDDLMVLGRNESNRMFMNAGDGTFTDITIHAGVAGARMGSASCSFGDINNDGRLDLVVSNTFDWSSLTAIAVEPYALNQANELYENLGANTFSDISDTSGIRDNAAPLPPGEAAISWAVTMVDYDQDGDTDIVFADDQGAIPPGLGLDRGYLQVFTNDGSGFVASAHGSAGSWMGEAWADINHDGTLDVFGSNFGDYGIPFLGLPYTLGEQASRQLIGTGSGFDDPGVGASVVAGVFGWGSSAEDFDNDGDTDVIYHGGLDLTLFVESSNPGALLLNDGAGNLSVDLGAFPGNNHVRRFGAGVATGDLNNDGFVDIVSVAAERVPEPLPVVPYAAVGITYGGPFDAVASFAPRFAETEPGSGAFVWLGFDYLDGNLTVEINNAESGHNSLQVNAVGGVGLTGAAGVNRSGVGAVMRVTPKHADITATRPVTAGSSFASAHALTQTFGLGDANKATVEVLWPGGVINRLYGARGTVTFPEIPCSIDTDASFGAYQSCVRGALADYVAAGIIDNAEVAALKSSAFRAYQSVRRQR